MNRLSRLLARICSALSNTSTSQRPLRQPPRLRVEHLETRLTPATFNIANGNVAGLIAAITTANSNNQPDIINLAPGGVYTLTAIDNGFDSSNTGLPVITLDTSAANTLTIQGRGATIRRSSAVNTPKFRLLANDSGSVIFNDLSFRNGRLNSEFSEGSSGGGIWNNGAMTLNRCTVTGNATMHELFASGGGIYNGYEGRLTINNSTISGNSANVLPSENTREIGGAFGGGIDSRGYLTLRNSTISGNSVHSGNVGRFGGGGIGIANYLGAVTTTIINCTITKNHDNTGLGGGGMIVFSGSTSVVLKSSIVAGNTSTNPVNGPDISGELNVASCFNLIGIGTSELAGVRNGVNGNMVGTQARPIDPHLGALANNGGPTMTHALQANSAALGKGRNFTPFLTDQRGTGFPRRTGDVVDIGAVQFARGSRLRYHRRTGDYS